MSAIRDTGEVPRALVAAFVLTAIALLWWLQLHR